MVVDSKTLDAVRRIVGTPEGKLLLEYLTKLEQVEVDGLVANVLPEQTRCLQGRVQITRQFISLFKPK